MSNRSRCSCAISRRCWSSARRRRRRSFFPRRSTSSNRSSNALTDLRADELTGRRVAIAPARAGRPGAARLTLEKPTAEELASCPFCAGHEDMTPPQTLVLPEVGAWRVRVVPNLYPALDRQEVVVHSPEHIRSLAELSDDQLALVAE